MSSRVHVVCTTTTRNYSLDRANVRVPLYIYRSTSLTVSARCLEVDFQGRHNLSSPCVLSATHSQKRLFRCTTSIEISMTRCTMRDSAMAPVL